MRAFLYQWNFQQSLIQLSQDGPLYILRGHKLYFPQKYYISFSEDQFYLNNSADPKEMLHYVAFYLGLHWLLKKYLFKDF